MSVGPGGPPDTPTELNLATKRDSSAANSHTNIKCPECDTVQSATHKKCSNCGHDLTSAIKAKFANMSASAAIYGHGLNLADEAIADSDGLVWKEVCKTGTLALSPGPGQIDVEKPLDLTPELFDDLVKSVEDPAFPHITIPKTHDNNLMENTGYVRKIQVKESDNPSDPDGTKSLWAGMEFTDPEVKKKVLEGSIADTSVGIKFNYRRKRDGKEFPAALEHVNLTNQPWVDGMVPFGQALSQEPYDQAQDGKTPEGYIGVFKEPTAAEAIYLSADQANTLHLRAFTADKRRELAKKGAAMSDGSFPIENCGDVQNAVSLVGKGGPGAKAHIIKRAKALNCTTKLPDDWNLSQEPPKPEDILPDDTEPGEVPAVPDEPTTPAKPERTKRTVESLLASQQAEGERIRADLSAEQEARRQSDQRLALAERKLAEKEIDERVRQFQADGMAPVLVERYRDVRLALLDQSDDDDTLKLSISTGKDGETEEREFDTVGLIEHLLSAAPSFANKTVAEFAAEQTLALSATKPSEKSAAEKADEIERELHPERYGDDGKRKAEAAA